MRSKNYQKIKEKISEEAVSLEAAAELLKEKKKSKFDETVEVHIHLGIDPTKSDQMVRGSVVLPAGSVKKQKLVVFSDVKKEQEEAKKAGAVEAGGDELIEKILEDKTLDADITISTPKMMTKVAKAAKILGPKGLMPNPKTGTVTEKPADVVKELMGGKITYKMDQLGNIHIAAAKLSWEKEKIINNIEAVLGAVKKSRPESAKGEFMKSVSIKSTMSPAVRIAT